MSKLAPEVAGRLSGSVPSNLETCRPSALARARRRAPDELGLASKFTCAKSGEKNESLPFPQVAIACSMTAAWRSADWPLPGPELMERDEAFIDEGDHHHRECYLNQKWALRCITKDK